MIKDKKMIADLSARGENKPVVVRSPLSLIETRYGSYVLANGLHDGRMMTVSHFDNDISLNEDYKPIIFFNESTTGEYLKDIEGVPLTEEIIMRLRRKEREDFEPIEFSRREPGERQIEFQYWSNWINEDYKLHLCPSYDTNWIDGKPQKSNEVKFWFCWLCDGNRFVSLKNIRGDNTLKYVHQLQNIIHLLTGCDLVLR